jgi:peptidoglycan/LPS O-acetylase OafA/YrhL
MLKDAIRFIRLRPGLYLASVKQGFMIYFHSSSDYLLLKDKTTPTLESFWDKIFYGQLSDYRGDFANRWKNSPIYVGWFLVIAYVAAAAYGLKVILSRSKYDVVFVAIIAFMTFTILYFTFAANFFDLGENNRFRFTLDPLVLLIAGHLLQNWLFKRERRST